jgi:predicted ATPase/class 3 adenylate cyclase
MPMCAGLPTTGFEHHPVRASGDRHPYIAAMQAFLFTDIEASTRLWEEQPANMGPALERHFAILSAAVESAGGTVLKTTGDGIVAVFGSVPDSLSASLDAQEELTTEDWGPIGPMRVRMGIHAGEAEHGEGDYFGPVMNRAARIMAAGHGGQVLVSGKVAEVAGDRLPSGATLRDLGSHRLKDLTLPEHLYQLLHGDLQSDFPPPFTLDARPNNLPLQTTEFLGRGSELDAIEAMLMAPATRLLTIFGPGGAGKTRLGLQAAAELTDRFRDGAFFVDLSNERDSDAAFEAVVRALDLPAAGGANPLETLQTRLRDRQMILVLDNFEQVTAAGTGVVGLLQQCPELKVLVTSRETLRVRAEHVYPVPPLSLPDPRAPASEIGESESVQLFTERARAVRPDFTFTEENASVIAMICLRLDGLPLAIELAAARLRLFSPADLLDRLQTRLDVLGAGGRDLPDRQRTLWGAIGWSYELLDESERLVFEMMSVFSPTRLEAIEAVAASTLASVDLIESLASLVDKSLVKSEASGDVQRFSMLLMIREYAIERLAESPEREQAVRRAHADYFCEYTQRLSGRLRGPERLRVLGDLADDIGNLRTAWRYWVDQGDLKQLFLLLDGLWALHDAKGWYHAAIELATDTLEVLATAEPSPELAAEELTLRTSLARALMAVRGYDVEVEKAFKQVLEMAKAAGGAAQQVPVLRALASYYQNTADWARAGEIGSQLLALAGGGGDESILVDGHFVVGASLAFSGDLDSGLQHFDESIRLFDSMTQGADRFRLGPHTGISARVASGLLLWQCGAVQRGIARVTEALNIAEDLEHPYSICYAIYHNGFLELARSRFEMCGQRARQLARVAGENDYAIWRTLATVLEGISLTCLGRVDRGLEMTEAGIELYRGLTTPPVFWPLVLNLRGKVHGLAGNPARGIELVDEAIALIGYEETAWPYFRINKGDLLRMLPDPSLDEVQEAYETAVRGSRRGGLRMFELQALNRMVALRRERGFESDQSDELRSLYETFTDGFDEHDLVVTRTLLGIDTVAATTPG